MRLDEAALCIAAHAEPALDVDAYLQRIDDLAASVSNPTLDGLVRQLFSGGQLTGNREDYYDPRNSLLNHVLDRRLGIPITLAVVALEVGRRIGVPMSGVGMPGHFLLRDKVDQTVFVDPFDHGRFLDAQGCERLFRRLAGPDADWDPAWLEPVDRPTIITRMLANLKACYLRRQDLRAVGWVMRLRCAMPDATRQDQREWSRLMAPLN